MKHLVNVFIEDEENVVENNKEYATGYDQFKVSEYSCYSIHCGWKTYEYVFELIISSNTTKIDFPVA